MRVSKAARLCADGLSNGLNSDPSRRTVKSLSGISGRWGLWARSDAWATARYGSRQELVGQRGRSFGGDIQDAGRAGEALVGGREVGEIGGGVCHGGGAG